MFKMFFNKKRNSDKTQNKKESEIFKTTNNVNSEENSLNKKYK